MRRLTGLWLGSCLALAACDSNLPGRLAQPSQTPLPSVSPRVMASALPSGRSALELALEACHGFRMPVSEPPGTVDERAYEQALAIAAEEPLARLTEAAGADTRFEQARRAMADYKAALYGSEAYVTAKGGPFYEAISDECFRLEASASASPVTEG